MAHVETLTVELAWSPARGRLEHRWLTLPTGCRLAQALAGCADFVAAHPEWEGLSVGIWGRLQPMDTVLRDRDRIELYRPLTVDPKEARRQRYRAKGERIVSRHRPLAGKPQR